MAGRSTRFLFLACVFVQSAAGDGPMFVAFDESPADNAMPPELMINLVPGSVPGGPEAALGARSREELLDQALASMLEIGSAPVAASPASNVAAAAQQASGRIAPPLGVLRQLFPGPLVIEEGAGGPGRVLPLAAPDPVVMDMLQGVGPVIQEAVLPAVHALPAPSGVPDSCGADVRAHCGSARSQLHCLGQHASEISGACRKDVGQSVPFLCSQAIDRWCDVLHSGILPCLTGKLQELDGACRDAVLATRDVLVQAAAGSTAKPLVPVAPPANPTQHEAHLDSKLRGAATAATDAGSSHLQATGTVVAAAAAAASRSAATAASGGGTLKSRPGPPAELAAPANQPMSPLRLLLLSFMLTVAAGIIVVIIETPCVSERVWISVKNWAGEGGRPLYGGIKHQHCKATEL